MDNPIERMVTPAQLAAYDQERAKLEKMLDDSITMFRDLSAKRGNLAAYVAFVADMRRYPEQFATFIDMLVAAVERLASDQLST